MAEFDQSNQIKYSYNSNGSKWKQIKYFKFQDTFKSIQIKFLPEKTNQIISNQILNIKVNLILFNSNFLSAKEIQLKLNQIFWAKTKHELFQIKFSKRK